MEDNKKETGEVSLINRDSRVFRFLDNFWYHYKAPFLIVLVFAVFLTVSVVQCAKKQKYDLYVLYAGGHEVSGVADGVLSEREAMINALAPYAPDKDENGKKTVALETLYWLSPDEKTKTENANILRLSEDDEILRSDMIFSDYYLCFLSENAYISYQNQTIFVKLTDYTENLSLDYLDDYAVRLSSLAIADMPGFSSLPEDTVLVLRGLSEVAQHTNAKKNAENFAAAEEAVRAILR